MTLRTEAIFLNGVFAQVLEEIYIVQEHLPHQIMFLQPYNAKRIKLLAEHPPSVHDCVRLFMSTTANLSQVQYAAEIVGWDNKQELPRQRLLTLNRLLWTLQPGEGGLYYIHEDEPRQSVNLLHVWKMKRLSKPFLVSELTLTSNNQPHSTDRSTAGGWSYVHNPDDAWLRQFE